MYFRVVFTGSMFLYAFADVTFAKQNFVHTKYFFDRSNFFLLKHFFCRYKSFLWRIIPCQKNLDFVDFLVYSLAS